MKFSKSLTHWDLLVNNKIVVHDTIEKNCFGATAYTNKYSCPEHHHIHFSIYQWPAKVLVATVFHAITIHCDKGQSSKKTCDHSQLSRNWTFSIFI